MSFDNKVVSQLIKFATPLCDVLAKSVVTFDFSHLKVFFYLKAGISHVIYSNLIEIVLP